MKTAYVLMGGWYFEGETVVGVFSTENKARKEEEKVEDDYSFTEIHAWTIDGEKK